MICQQIITRSVLRVRAAVRITTAMTIQQRPPPISFQGIQATRLSSNDSSDSCHKPISRFPIPNPKTLPEDLQAIMSDTEEKSGFVPNVFKALSHRPAEMRAFIDYYSAVMGDRDGGNINKTDKEMIIVAISSMNRCRYCIIAHSALYRIFSKNPILADQVAANWETADLDGRQRAILEFAIDVANCKPLQEDKFSELYAHGLTEEDAWDIGAVVALFSLSNRMAFLTSMAPNEEFYLMGRIPKNKSK